MLLECTKTRCVEQHPRNGRIQSVRRSKGGWLFEEKESPDGPSLNAFRLDSGPVDWEGNRRIDYGRRVDLSRPRRDAYRRPRGQYLITVAFIRRWANCGILPA